MTVVLSTTSVEEAFYASMVSIECMRDSSSAHGIATSSRRACKRLNCQLIEGAQRLRSNKVVKVSFDWHFKRNI